MERQWRIKALFDALNAVYEEKEKRSFIGLNDQHGFHDWHDSLPADRSRWSGGASGRAQLPAELLRVGPNIARWPVLLVLVAFGPR
jgi:hypothetical protein